MLKKDKVKIINGAEHQGNTFKEQGKILKLVDDLPLKVIIAMPFAFIFIEMAVFALVYKVMSSSSFNDSINYSILSAIGERVDASIQNSFWINWLISFQSILTNCIISFFMAVVLYKLMSIKPKLIKMEDHLVFDPSSGTLRLRIVNISKFELKNVCIDADFRLHIPKSGRHASAKLKLKVNNISCLRPYTPWNIATKPFIEDSKPRGNVELNISEFDRNRICDFIPDLLNEKYRSDDIEIAKRNDYINLNLTITIKSPLFDNDWIYYRSFKTEDFVCGQLKRIEHHISGKIIMDWSNWGQYEDMSESYCKDCVFSNNCSIIKRNTTIS